MAGKLEKDPTVERLKTNERAINACSFFAHLYLLIAVIFGWALFYLEDFGQLLHFLQVMVFAGGNELWNFKLTLVLKENAFWLIDGLSLCYFVLYMEIK